MSTPSLSSPAAPRDWLRVLRDYREPSHARSFFEIVITAALFAAFWFGSWFALQWSWSLSLAIAIPAAGFLVRLFMIQHDCGHGTLFRHRRLNDWIGRTIGALTLTPYDHWRRSQNRHHASSGNLDRRGTGDIDTLTVREYLQRSRRQRLAYRIYRNPLVMFGLGPAYLFLIQHRLPVGAMLAGWRPWLSTMGTNLAIALVILTTAWFVGWRPFVLVHLPITLLASSIGVWLFYVQHQFEETLGRRVRLDHAGGRTPWQLTLRSARCLALVHSQHWHPSCSSPVQSHSVLPVDRRPTRSSRVGQCRTADTGAELPLRTACALGRGPA